MTSSQNMQYEKKRVALVSVLAAVFLTGIKLAAGLATGSLGILSEAAHSGLDLGASLLTYVAVRIADKPADEDHAYGHGKIENIIAFFQAAILLGTCFFIIREAVARLSGEPHLVEVNALSFLVLGISMAVDFVRSRALLRLAKQYRSQALEADALHFSTDIWSSFLVIIGLIFSAYGFMYGDSIAALGVAGFVIFVSISLLKRTIEALTDRTPQDIEEKIKKGMADVEGLLGYRHLRVRQSGSKVFIDMYLDIKRTVPFSLAHLVTDIVETRIAEIVPNADVIIHMEPREAEDESIIDKIRMVVTEESLACHNVRAQKVGDKFFVDFHLECETRNGFMAAHEASTRIERRLKFQIPEIEYVKVHIEDSRDRVVGAENITNKEAALLDLVREIVSSVNTSLRCDDIVVLQTEGNKKLMMNCYLDSVWSLDQVHSVLTQVENKLHIQLPELGQVVIHPEIEVLSKN